MPSQVLISQLSSAPVPAAWVAFLRAHSALTRQLNADLVSRHGLTLNDYEVLLQLSKAPERRLRRVDLVERLLLTASGITRLLDGLQRAGYVAKAACASDARVTYAVLTDAGLEKLRETAGTHREGIGRRFSDRFAALELEQLAALLERLTDGSGPGSCEPGA
ncbi:MAG: MarR family winged helix-turn-helix transcriptional regulator [Gaiellaceae bacterium]